MELEAYELVLLWRAHDAASYDEETLDRLQREHVAYPALRGLTLFCTGSLDEARRLAAEDPLVLARRLRFDVMTFWCQPGALRGRGQPVTVDEP